MRFVIEQNGIKRFLRGSFSIICSRSDLEYLVKRLTRALETDEVGAYGGIDIHERLPTAVNTPPREWDE
jgi:hypothetical protein